MVLYTMFYLSYKVYIYIHVPYILYHLLYTTYYYIPNSDPSVYVVFWAPQSAATIAQTPGRIQKVGPAILDSRNPMV